MKHHQINSKQLKNIIRENVKLVLKEEAEKKELETSLDQQVDDFFANYENESKLKKNEGFDLRSMTRRFLLDVGLPLLEADEDKKDDNKDKKVDNEKSAEVPRKLTLDDIDIENFASSVVRLIDNYDSLLEVRNTLARRAKNFLSKNYTPDVVKTFENVLADEHDLKIGESHLEKDAGDFQAPPADRAGVSPGGGT